VTPNYYVEVIVQTIIFNVHSYKIQVTTAMLGFLDFYCYSLLVI